MLGIIVSTLLATASVYASLVPSQCNDFPLICYSGNDDPPAWCSELVGRSDSALKNSTACDVDYKVEGTTNCIWIEREFRLVPGTVQVANPHLWCDKIKNGTHVCIPVVPFHLQQTEPGCGWETYLSEKDDTCDKIESKFALHAGSVHESNQNVNCNSIDTNTSLRVCVPFTDVSKDCPNITEVKTDTTCATVGGEFLSAAWIKALNPSVADCSKISAGTTLCAGHD